MLKAEQYAKLRKEATEELKRTSKLIDAYAPMLAAINSDYLQPIERQAQALAEQGKVDEAVRLYEDLKLQDKFHRGIDMKSNGMTILRRLSHRWSDSRRHWSCRVGRKTFIVLVLY